MNIVILLVCESVTLNWLSSGGAVSVHGLVMNCLMHFFQAPDLATEDEYWDLWEAVKVDDIDVVMFILTFRSEISAAVA